MNSLDELLSFFSSNEKTLIIDKSLTSSINYLIPFSRLKQLTNISQVYWFDDKLNRIEGEIVFLIDSKLQNVEILENRLREIENNDIQIILTNEFFKTFQYQLELKGIYLEYLKWDFFINDEIIQNFYHLNKKLNLIEIYNGDSIINLSNIENLLQKFISKFPNYNPTQFYYQNSGNCIKFYQSFKSNQFNLKGLETSGLKTNLIILERNYNFPILIKDDNNSKFINIIQEYQSLEINKIEDFYFNDELFPKLKFMDFEQVCLYLNSEAKTLQSRYTELKNSKTSIDNNNNENNNTSNLNEIVVELNRLENFKKLLIKYTNLCEILIKNLGINDPYSQFNKYLSILQNPSQENLLELIKYDDIDINYIIRSLLITGLSDSIKSSLIDKYGINYLFKLQSLLNVKNCIPIKPYNSNINDIQDIKKILNSIRSNIPLDNFNIDRPNRLNIGKSKEKNILLMIGGITYNELNLIEDWKKENDIEIVIISDGIINHRSIL
ncbi:hypothetical protein WICMUC_001045 [Wickerhamomyces mucosus]|uniref:Uncharacterized protein n=1 Tax=Wickerhamomyces mucosus TaxID=1378264 RepID=A0A9P8PY41_9ASCO|nr:hypothetical protein WICMUC_001045 [Wickerhamomyces mucosus]